MNYTKIKLLPDESVLCPTLEKVVSMKMGMYVTTSEQEHDFAPDLCLIKCRDSQPTSHPISRENHGGDTRSRLDESCDRKHAGKTLQTTSVATFSEYSIPTPQTIAHDRAMGVSRKLGRCMHMLYTYTIWTNVVLVSMSHLKRDRTELTLCCILFSAPYTR